METLFEKNFLLFFNLQLLKLENVTHGLSSINVPPPGLMFKFGNTSEDVFLCCIL